MKNIKKIIIVIGVLVIIGLLIWLDIQSSKEIKKTEELTPTPTMVQKPKFDSNNDGGNVDEFTDQEMKIMRLIAILRRKTPLESDIFVMNFNENKNVFNVKLKESVNKTVFENWLKNEGYKEIPEKYFIFE